MGCKIIETETQEGIRYISWQQAGHGEAIETVQLRRRLEELNGSMDARIREATNRAFQEGSLSTRKAMEGDVRETVARLAVSIESAATARKEAIERAESDVIRLAIEIARRILHRETTVDPEALKGLVSLALEKLKQQEILRARVHPEQEQALRTCLAKVAGNRQIEVVPDPLLPRGGAIFDLSRGALDASVEGQLREIERGLADQLRNRD